MEQWKKYDERYEVSTLGRVRTIRTQHIKKQVEHKFGYLYVYLSHNHNTTAKSVHRMVADTFIPNIYNLAEVDHINCNKKDNRVDNLRWVSSSENKLLAIDNNLWTNNKKHWFGERKPIIAINIETGEKTQYISLNQAEKVYGKHIVDVLKGRRTQTKGYYFEYLMGGDANATKWHYRSYARST